ncbi:MAG TPA: hypothetical protein VMV10_24975 [Pirellulales bacterium]|nr:hypothetical protein [Pirellulales bacterium]
MKNRSRYRLYLAGVLGAIFLPLGGCGAAASPEQPVIAAIEQLGGSVRRDKGHVVKVDLHKGRATESDLEQLEKLAHLDRLYLPPAANDAWLAHLQGLNELTKLDLQYTQVTDAGLAQLASLPKLVQLYTYGSQVTAAGIEQLQKARPQLTVEVFPIERP